MRDGSVATARPGTSAYRVLTRGGDHESYENRASTSCNANGPVVKRSPWKLLRWALDALGLCFIWSIFAGGQLASLIPVAVISTTLLWMAWVTIVKRADDPSDR